jgi:hypothetical protein
LKGNKNGALKDYQTVLVKVASFEVTFDEITPLRKHYQRLAKKEIISKSNDLINSKIVSTNKLRGTLKEKRVNFLKLFPNFAISRNGEKRIPLLQYC